MINVTSSEQKFSDVICILLSKFGAFYSKNDKPPFLSIDDFYNALQTDSNGNYRYKWVTKEMVTDGLNKLFSHGMLIKTNDNLFRWGATLA